MKEKKNITVRVFCCVSQVDVKIKCVLELEWPQLTPGSYAAASIANCLLGNEEGAIAYRDKMKKSGTEHDMPSVDGVEECIKSLNTRRIPSASNHAAGQNPRRPRVLHDAQVSPLPI